MKNDFFKYFVNVIKIKITGKNAKGYLKRIINKKIELLEIIKKDNQCYEIKIYENDYNKLKDIKTICDVKIIDIYGMKKLKKIISLNQYVIFFIILGVILIVFLSNIIFNVEVIHNDPNIRKLITTELNKYDIKKYKLIKNYKDLEIIKQKILDNYKDKIEWLEIERIGTKYVVRVEERIINDREITNGKGHIIATHNAIIKSIKVVAGERIKNVNDYVRKGDILISGDIKLNEEVKDTVRAMGTVYGEVWYNVTSTVPLYYYEEIKTGKRKKILTLKILNNRYELTLDKYKEKQIDSKNLLNSNLLPISLVKENQVEVIKQEKFYTKDEAVIKAIEEATDRITSSLTDKEKIIDIKKLKVRENNSTISVDMFFTVIKNIGESVDITEE